MWLPLTYRKALLETSLIPLKKSSEDTFRDTDASRRHERKRFVIFFLAQYSLSQKHYVPSFPIVITGKYNKLYHFTQFNI